MESPDASPTTPQDWKAINWRKVEKEVRRGQARIAKATRKGQHRKAKALQWLLLHSYYGRLLAVRRVVTNKGKKTPGVDGVVWKTPESRVHAAQELRTSGYRPQPLRRTYIPKKSGKRRPLSIPVMKCRAMQALHNLALSPASECFADPNSYGFRPKRSCADAISQCFIALAKKHSAQWVLEADIRSCFDEISHDWMLRHIPMDKKLLEKWLKCGYVEKENLLLHRRTHPLSALALGQAKAQKQIAQMDERQVLPYHWQRNMVLLREGPTARQIPRDRRPVSYLVHLGGQEAREGPQRCQPLPTGVCRILPEATTGKSSSMVSAIEGHASCDHCDRVDRVKPLHRGRPLKCLSRMSGNSLVRF